MAAGEENEFQPEAPDMASALQLDTDEALTGPSDSDPLDSGYVPPDRPYGVEDNAVTPAGEREGESLDERLAKELPDEPLATDPGRSGRLVSATDSPAGDPATDVEAVEVGIDGGAASAEEAAVHDADVAVEPVLDETPTGDPEVSAQLAEDADHADEAAADAERDARS
ncbi:DUF5709 domain-containing protein [Pseudonocardia sp. HH130630-07]|uniref:DUF5709 domain-containing protein n=1 Tax=Pseudonocardia sp. HH130630-07 TaxID=1690815 RepID=UPI000814C58C|nr:DUF5709 domain-containing protein [Pseudonocardia sp. HH130630-07]ANY08573.1 hypothetical protein AFB00_22460 [Pseudonocardia sp. HH130630-07]